ncbi:MAG: hypothetical protein NLN65_05635, partial [Candidatus Poseidoniaceae archaeon]|nr:hypothetical protein [Candidatus Poseidoniaceae archaeon]
QPADSRTGRGSVYFMGNGPSLYVEKGELTSPVSTSTEMLKASSLPQICEAEQCRVEDQEILLIES